MLDLNNITYELDYHDARRKKYKNPTDYDEKYINHHLFFDKDEIGDFLKILGFSGITYPKHSVPNYINADYRFNIIGTK